MERVGSAYDYVFQRSALTQGAQASHARLGSRNRISTDFGLKRAELQILIVTKCHT
jgi:hypothetical protein